MVHENRRFSRIQSRKDLTFTFLSSSPGLFFCVDSSYFYVVVHPGKTWKINYPAMTDLQWMNSDCKCCKCLCVNTWSSRTTSGCVWSSSFYLMLLFWKGVNVTASMFVDLWCDSIQTHKPGVMSPVNDDTRARKVSTWIMIWELTVTFFHFFVHEQKSSSSFTCQCFLFITSNTLNSPQKHDFFVSQQQLILCVKKRKHTWIKKIFFVLLQR